MRIRSGAAGFCVTAAVAAMATAGFAWPAVLLGWTVSTLVMLVLGRCHREPVLGPERITLLLGVLTMAAAVLKGTAARIVHHIVDDVAKRLALIVGAVRLRDKLHAHRALLEDDLLTTLVFAQPAKGYHLHELLALRRHWTKAVGEPLTVSCQVIIGLDVVELTVKQHALTAARHIGLGEVHLQVALHGAVLDKVAGLDVFAGFEFFGIEIAELLVFQFTDSLVENLLIGLVAQVFHESALFGTQQIARAADVQILHGKIETAAQVGEGLQSFQAAACLRCHRAAWRSQQIAEGLAVATAHSATHLMQVGQPEMIGTVDDDRVGIGNVNTVLHNCR